MKQYSFNKTLLAYYNKILLCISYMLCSLVFNTILSSSVIAYNTTDESTINILKQRLQDEEKLYQASQDLYNYIDFETAKILEKIKEDSTYKDKSPTYILEQYRLQAIKTSLQAKRIKIDIETIDQEIIATDNAIFQLENKLQLILGADKQLFMTSDSSVNSNIKKLQTNISYHKVISEINNKRLKTLNNYYDLVSKIYSIQENFLSQLQIVIDDDRKQSDISELNNKELEINNRIQALLRQELEYKNQIKKLSIINLASNEDLAQYNVLYINIIDAVNQRGILELDLSLLRLNSRLSEIANLFDAPNKEALKNKKNLSERVFRLQKESAAIKDIVNNKLIFISENVNFIKKEMQANNISVDYYNKTIKLLDSFKNIYIEYLKSTTNTVNQLLNYTVILKDLYLKDISVRQNFPDGLSEWQELFSDFISIPYLLSKQILVSWLQFQNYFNTNTAVKYLKIILLEISILAAIGLFFKFVRVFRQKYNQISLDRFSKLAFYILGNFLANEKIVISFLFNIIVLLWFTGVSGIFIKIFLLLAGLYLLIKFLINFCYIFLIENTLEISGDDSRLYRGLKHSLYFGSILFAVMILGQSLNLAIATLGFIDRLFMLFLLAISYPLIINWQVVPQLIVDSLQPKPYVRRAIWLLGIIVPVTILSNAALGIIGYVNLAWKIAVAEFQLSIIITIWLILKGVFSEIMEMISRFFIRNVTNGWLWTESVLKPLHTVINVSLFIFAILGLVIIYGWNSNLELLKFIHNIIEYHLFNVPGATPEEPVKVSIGHFLVFCVIFALVIWATKWSREFSYRWLYAKTKDLAVRNSFAVFTQYATLVVGIFIILKVLGIPTATLMVTIGGLLFFLGFGLRDIISNYISGIILLIERQVRTGDLVTIGDFEGKVTKIGMRSITVESFDNMEVIVPNTDTITKPLINWTFKDTIIRLELDLRISYEDSLELVRELILKVFEENDEILEEPIPKVYFKEFSDTAIIAKIYYFIDLNKSPSRGAVRTDVMLAMNKMFNAHNIKVAYPKEIMTLESRNDIVTQDLK